MTDPAGIADVQALADSLPRGHVDRGNGETMQAEFYLSYEAGRDMWEIEYCALDPNRSFLLQNQNLGDLLIEARERVARPTCEHEWVDMTNTHRGGSIESGAMCQNCGLLAPGSVLDGTSRERGGA